MKYKQNNLPLDDLRIIFVKENKKKNFERVNVLLIHIFFERNKIERLKLFMEKR